MVLGLVSEDLFLVSVLPLGITAPPPPTQHPLPPAPCQASVFNCYHLTSFCPVLCSREMQKRNKLASRDSYITGMVHEYKSLSLEIRDRGSGVPAQSQLYTKFEDKSLGCIRPCLKNKQTKPICFEK